MSPKTENIQWLNTLRAIATVGVITVHVSTPVLKMAYGGDNMDFWWTGNIIDSSVRFVIAMFLMLSGATMLGKKYDLLDFYKRRMMRVLVPFLFWLVAYWIFRWYMLLPKNQPTEFHSILNWALELFKTEGVSKHFWYIYMILVLYLFVPLLSSMVQKLKNNSLLLLLLCWAMINLMQNFRLFSLSEFPFVVQKAHSYLMYTGFMVLGYYLIKIKTLGDKITLISILVFFATIAFAAISTFILSRNAHKLDMSAYGSLTLNTILQAVALFLWIKNTNIKNRFLTWTVQTISNYSYGIYLVHIMVIGIFFRNGIFWTMAHPIISLPIIITMTLICSNVIIFVLRKLPLGNYFAG